MYDKYDIDHKFLLRGLRAGKSFFGCKKCWHMEVDSFCPHCPHCSQKGLPVPMGYFTVTESDKRLL